MKRKTLIIWITGLVSLLLVGLVWSVFLILPATSQPTLERHDIWRVRLVDDDRVEAPISLHGSFYMTVEKDRAWVSRERTDVTKKQAEKTKPQYQLTHIDKEHVTFKSIGYAPIISDDYEIEVVSDDKLILKGSKHKYAFELTAETSKNINK